MWGYRLLAAIALCAVAPPPALAAAGTVTVRVDAFALHFSHGAGSDAYALVRCSAVADYLPLNLKAYCRINYVVQPETVPVNSWPTPVAVEEWHGYVPTPWLVCAGVIVTERDQRRWSPPEDCGEIA